MDLNADFSRRAVVHAASLDWTPSPMAGVARRMLDRIGDEVARATSIVRYDAGSHFSAHSHGGGEEFLVLEGVFQDEHGDFPAGSYIRNPPGSSHTPGSEAGCVILVKLWQFDPEDRSHIRLDTAKVPPHADPLRPGVTLQPLFRDTREDVRLETWAPGARVGVDTTGGAEIFVLEGGFTEGGESFAPQSWLRMPDGAPLVATAGPNGARAWIKTGHLSDVRAPTGAAA